MLLVLTTSVHTAFTTFIKLTFEFDKMIFFTHQDTNTVALYYLEE
jgi:hypothetical protein